MEGIDEIKFMEKDTDGTKKYIDVINEDIYTMLDLIKNSNKEYIYLIHYVSGCRTFFT